jgi:UDP-N-acetylmuramate dehydrogenase
MKNPPWHRNKTFLYLQVLSNIVSMSDLFSAHSLQKFNTFGLEISAAWFCSPASLDSLNSILENEEIRELPRLVIGEGSNLLFTDNYKGLVIHPDIQGIELIEDGEDQVLIRVGAGENWDRWVRHANEMGWYGLENLSMIPGSVGAAPVQNIGAYGVELKEHFAWLEAWDLHRNEPVKLDGQACRFGYRTSLFKSQDPGRYIITHVTFRLHKTPEMVLDYGNVRKAFTEAGGSTPAHLRNIILDIRSSKLPDPARFGNAGSFFKNPVVGNAIYKCIRVENPGMPHYPAEDNKVKIPAAWLIEKAGWKGHRTGNVGTWPNQPLVIVNYGGASGREIFEFSEQVREDVDRKFGIMLEREVQVIQPHPV